MRRKIRGFFFVAFAINTLLLACDGAFAEETRGYFDGNALFTQYATGNPVMRDAATEYVIGVIDTIHLLRSTDSLRTPVLCMPRGVQIRQAGDVVKKYLEDHPEGRHNAAASLVLLALLNAFPCPRSETK